MSKVAPSPAPVDHLVESEVHLRAVLEAVPIVLTRVSGDGTFLAINQAGLAVFGASSLEQILGTKLVELLPEDARAECQAFISRAITGQRGSCEVELMSLAGTTHLLELRATPHPGAPDGYPSALVSCLDVGESRRLEKSLFEASARHAEQEGMYAAERSRLLGELERLAPLAAQLNQAVETGKRLQSELDELTGKLTAADDHWAGLERSHAAEKAGLESQLVVMDSDREQALGLARSLQAALDEREAAVADLTTRLELLEAEKDQSRTLIADLKSHLGERTQQAADLSDHLSVLEVEQAALRASAEHALHELSSRHEEQVVGLSAQLTEGQAELARMAETIRSAEEAAARRDAEMATLEQALVTERDRLESELAAARNRVHSLQTSLAAEAASRFDMDHSYHVLVGAMERVVNDAIRSRRSTSGATLADRLKAELPTRLGGGFAVSVLGASDPVAVMADEDSVMGAMAAIADARRRLMPSGQVTVELAPVLVDEHVSRARGFSPGSYLLVAMQVAGPAAGQSWPDRLFDNVDLEAWGEVAADLPDMITRLGAAGGYLWLTRDGESTVTVEIYLARRDEAGMQ